MFGVEIYERAEGKKKKKGGQGKRLGFQVRVS